MAPDHTNFHGSYTSCVKDCGHIIHYSTPSPLELKLSRPADTYGPPQDWEDEYPPVAFECVSANTFLCPTCEQAIYDERERAERIYQTIYDGGKGDCSEEGSSGPDRVAAAQYYRAATARVVNFEDRMADRTNTISQAEAVAAREKKWVAAKKVSFAVEEGMGPGEKEKKQRKKKKVALVMGPASDSAISLPLRGKEDS